MTESATAAPGAPTILLVDDEPAVRQLFALALQRAGYLVHQARTGEEAVSLFEAHPAIDLLLTDIRMPEMSGVELVRLLSARAPDLKVICISGYPGAETDPVITRHYLAKPFSRADLLAKVREVLGA
jgi:two-component system cell cycle sensor histidine kinase/response regulator CckA